MQSVYRANLAVLASRDEPLARRMEAVQVGKDITVLPSRDGSPTLRIGGVTIHSTYGPVAEGQRLSASWNLEDAEAVVVLGLGLGHHVRPLLDRVRGPVLIVESRPDVLKAAMQAVDLRPVLERCRLLVGTGRADAAGAAAVRGLGHRRPRVVEHGPCVRIDPGYYARWKAALTCTGLNILMASLSSPVSSPAFYERAFRKRHTVVTFGPYRDRAYWEGYAAELKTHAFYREGSAEHWADVCSRLAAPCDIVTERGVVDLRALRRRLPADYRPDLFVWIDQHRHNVPVNLEALECPTVALFGDTHLGDIRSRMEYGRAYDHVFLSFNRHHIPLFRQAGCRNVAWSPAACDPVLHRRIPTPKIYPVSFVGGTHPFLHGERVRLIQYLRSRGVNVYVDCRVLEDMALIFSRSRIVLNGSIGDDLNLRVFETLGTGSLLVTNRLSPASGLEELFQDRRHLVLYENREHLLDLLHYYLEHEDEAERIAEAGHREVLARHTYDHRVEEIVCTVMARERGEAGTCGRPEECRGFAERACA